MSGNISKALSSKPIRMWIDGRCFNIQQANSKQAKTVKAAEEVVSDEKKQSSEQIQEEDVTSSCASSDSDKYFDIQKDETGKLCTTFQLPSIYYIRLNQHNMKILSTQTQTNISVPQFGKTDKLTIKGEDENAIKEAVDQIYSIVGEIRDRYAALQFIGIPIKSEEIIKNFELFKSQILADKNVISGMEESIFQKAAKLHLTIDILVLLDDREKNEATKALNEYKESHLGPLVEKTGPLRIHLRGIECMNDNYGKVDVLYAKARIVDETEESSLQKITNDLSDYFYHRGFLKKPHDNVKLHCTLINTKYRKIPGPKRKWNRRQSFDATAIMEKYKDFEFGTCDMDSIHISIIQEKAQDGFYKPLSVIKL